MIKANQTITSAMKYGRLYLRVKGVSSCTLDSRVLLQHATGLTHAGIITNSREEMTRREFARYKLMLYERANRKPVAYITGQREFMGLNFTVNQHVLIPRPDTEVLVEEALRRIEENNANTILEIGTGSGCISISILRCAKKKLFIMGSDISTEALTIAKSNSWRNNATKTVFFQSDLFESVWDEVKVDLIVSNPPYIESGVIETLDADVKDYEPHSALDGGEDGLYFYRQIMSKGKEYLCEGGAILFEIGYDQSSRVEQLFAEHGFTDIVTIKDFAGHDRVVCGVLQ